MTHEPDALPIDVQRLLDAERAAPSELPSGSRDRLLQRLETSVGILAVTGGLAAALSTHAGGAGSSAAVVHGVSRLAAFFSRPWRTAVVAFVLGGATGAGIHAMARPSSSGPGVSNVDRASVAAPMIASPAADSASAAALPSESSVAAPIAIASAVPPTLAPPVVAIAEATVTSGARMDMPVAVDASAGKDSLGAERALLEVARTALSRGDSAAAMESLDRHVQRFPAGQLTEEREALYVQALARAGRHDEARARAARFEKRFPGSVFRPVVEAATE